LAKRKPAPSHDEAEALVLEQLELGASANDIVRYMRVAGLSAPEAKELVRTVRRRRRREIVEEMVTTLVEGSDEEETLDRFRGCGESEAWLRKAVKRASDQIEEVEVSNPTAFRRANLIGLGVFGIVGGLAATLISHSFGGTTSSVYVGALIAGILSLSSGLAMSKDGT
jgi:hypothetical protein